MMQYLNILGLQNSSLMLPIIFLEILQKCSRTFDRRYTKVKKGGYGDYKREDVETMLNGTTKKRTKSIILFLSATGCRVGALPELKLKHIVNYQNSRQLHHISQLLNVLLLEEIYRY